MDVASGLVHTLKGSAANEADITQTAALLHGQEEDVFGDAGYSGADKRPELADRDLSWNIAIKRSIIKALPQALRELAEPVEWALSQVRAVVEHPFHIVKNRFRHKKLALPWPEEEHRTATYSVCPGQSGDRQARSARSTGRIMPAVCRDAITASESSNWRPGILLSKRHQSQPAHAIGCLA